MATVNGTIYNDNDTWQNSVYYQSLQGTGKADTISGLGGNDILYGYGGADYLDGGSGADIMEGGDGDDIFMVDNINDIPREMHNNVQGGADTVNASVTHTLGYGIEHLNLYGENFTLNSGKIDGYGNGNNNAINGSGGINSLYGYGGDDALAGGGDDDHIYGGDGSDLLTGGMGKDHLNGGTGADIFDVNYVSESPFGALKDVILDFSGAGGDGDKIDLSTIDANLSIAGDQVFATDQLSFATGVLTGDVIGGPDLQIELTGVSSLNLVTDVVA